MDNTLVLLLSDTSPCLRYLTLTQLEQRDETDDEVAELARLRLRDGLLTPLLSKFYVDKAARDLRLLGYLGFGPASKLVQDRAEHLFSLQRVDGSWPLVRSPGETEGYSMIPLQTALPLIALACSGYSDDPRSEKAYDWLLDKRLEDGTWPTGLSSGVFGKVAGYRRLPHSRWGCRSNTTAVVKALSLHGQRRTSSEARRGLDHLLGCSSEDRRNLGFEVARTLGAEETRGFITYYGRLDPALILDLCWRIGADSGDSRVEGLLRFISSLRQPNGGILYEPKPQVSRWVSFDLLRSLSRIQSDTGWITMEPTTPFQEYPKPPRRW